MAMSKAVYQKWVNAAFGFFLLLGVTWLVMSGVNNHKLNIAALITVAVFGIQAYYKHLLANLIVGILALFFSIFMLLNVVDTFVNAHMPLAFGLLSALAIMSIVFSLILIFSYKKLNLE
jgi:hypothetical protein